MKTDLQQLEDRLDKRIGGVDEKLGGLERRMDERFTDLEKNLFDWKSEIVDAVDTMVKEIRDEREFREVAGQQLGENRSRIVKLEKKVFDGVTV